MPRRCFTFLRPSHLIGDRLFAVGGTAAASACGLRWDQAFSLVASVWFSFTVHQVLGDRLIVG